MVMVETMYSCDVRWVDLTGFVQLASGSLFKFPIRQCKVKKLETRGESRIVGFGRTNEPSTSPSPGYVLVDVDVLVLLGSITWEAMFTAPDLNTWATVTKYDESKYKQC